MNRYNELRIWAFRKLENRLSAIAEKLATCCKRWESDDPMTEQYEICGHRCDVLNEIKFLQKQAD